jgi:dATP pyrophosphohydrolase
MPADRSFKRPESVLVVIYTHALEEQALERVSPPGFWQSVTGTLDWGETAEECARREVREETGLDPSGLEDARIERTFPILPAWRARYAPGVTSNLERLWYLPLPERLPVTLNPAEHSRFEWLPAREAAQRLASWTNREAIERLLELG